MKKVLAWMFAVALSISLSSLTFAQTDTPADQQTDAAKKHHRHHHKHHRKTSPPQALMGDTE
jgi:uncharacterized protein YxeA